MTMFSKKRTLTMGPALCLQDNRLENKLGLSWRVNGKNRGLRRCALCNLSYTLSINFRERLMLSKCVQPKTVIAEKLTRMDNR